MRRVTPLNARHVQALRIISGRGHGTGRHWPEDLVGFETEVADLIREGLVRVLRYGRAERLTRGGRAHLNMIDALARDVHR